MFAQQYGKLFVMKMFFVMMAWQYYAETYCAEIVYILSRISS